MSLEMLTPASAPWNLREQRGFYIPDYLADADARPELYAAADAAAVDLREAERQLDDALNLVGTLRAALEDAGDARSMQADTVLKIVQGFLNKAHTAIDRHDTRFMNLFMAYFDRDGESRPDRGD